MNAISLNSAGMNTTRIIGPALAGVLIIYLGTAGVFYLIALFHAFSVVCTALIKKGRTQSNDSPGKGIVADIREGFQYAAGNPILLGLVIMNFVPSLFGFPYLALLPAWGREVLNIQPDGLGLLMTCVGIGSLMGVMGLASLYHLRRRGHYSWRSLLFGEVPWYYSPGVSPIQRPCQPDDHRSTERRLHVPQYDPYAVLLIT